MKSFSKAVFAGVLAMTAASPAFGQQQTSTLFEGTLSINFPPGWRRLDEMLRTRLPGSVEPDVILMADKGDSIMGQPGVSCTLKANSAPMPPGETSANANKKIRENPVLKKPLPTEGGVERKATVRGSIVAIEGTKVAGKSDDYMSWTSAYASHGKLITPSFICFPNVNRTGITPEIAKDVQAMFASITVTPK